MPEHPQALQPIASLARNYNSSESQAATAANQDELWMSPSSVCSAAPMVERNEPSRRTHSFGQDNLPITRPLWTSKLPPYLGERQRERAHSAQTLCINSMPHTHNSLALTDLKQQQQTHWNRWPSGVSCKANIWGLMKQGVQKQFS